MEYYLSVREKKLILHGHEKKYDSIYVNFHNEQNCSVTMGVRVMATLEGAIRESSGELEILSVSL